MVKSDARRGHKNEMTHPVGINPPRQNSNKMRHEQELSLALKKPGEVFKDSLTRLLRNGT